MFVPRFGVPINTNTIRAFARYVHACMDTMSSVFFPPSHFACIGRIDEETENEEKHPIATMEKITTLQLSIGRNGGNQWTDSGLCAWLGRDGKQFASNRTGPFFVRANDRGAWSLIPSRKTPAFFVRISSSSLRPLSVLREVALVCTGSQMLRHGSILSPKKDTT